MSKPYVERSASERPVGKFIYHDDLRKFQGKKFADDKKKKDLETKRFKKAAMLRKYAKLCKAEGIQSDRVRMGDKEKSDSDAPRAKKAKPDQHRPFKRAEAQATREEQAQKEKEESILERQRQKEDAIRKREEKHRALSKTTKKGQPKLGNHMKALLEKLQKA